MKDEARLTGARDDQRLLDGMNSIKRHLRRLILSVSLMTLFLILTIAALFGNLVNFFGREALMRGAHAMLLGIPGFFAIAVGLLALHKNRNGWLWGVFGALTMLIGGIALGCLSVLCPRCRRPLARNEWENQQCPSCGNLSRMTESFQSVDRHIVGLTVVVSFMALALFVTVSAVFGDLLNYFRGDVMLWGGSTAGAAVLGFVLGWLARRKV